MPPPPPNRPGTTPTDPAQAPECAGVSGAAGGGLPTLAELLHTRAVRRLAAGDGRRRLSLSSRKAALQALRNLAAEAARMTAAAARQEIVVKLHLLQPRRTLLHTHVGPGVGAFTRLPVFALRCRRASCRAQRLSQHVSRQRGVERHWRDGLHKCALLQCRFCIWFPIQSNRSVLFRQGVTIHLHG